MKRRTAVAYETDKGVLLLELDGHGCAFVQMNTLNADSLDELASAASQAAEELRATGKVEAVTGIAPDGTKIRIAN